MSKSDQILNYELSILLHVLGLFWLGAVRIEVPVSVDTAPLLEISAVNVLPPTIEDDSDVAGQAAGPASRAPDQVREQESDIPPLNIPEVEPPPQPNLPDKPAFAAALTPPPVPAPAPPPVPEKPAPPQEAELQLASLPTPPVPTSASPDQGAPRSAAPSDESPAAVAFHSGGSESGTTLLRNGGSPDRVDAHPSLERPIRPSYPIGARRRGEEGSVILDVSVGADGKVRSVSLVSSSGFSDLDRAAQKAASQASFTPATRDGRPIDALARLTLIFRLHNQ